MKIIFILIFIPFTLNASIENIDKKKVFEIKNQLIQQKKMIEKMNTQILKIEESLTDKNSKIIKIKEEKFLLEQNLNITKLSVEEDAKNLNKAFNLTKNILMGVILNRLEKSENSSDLLARKILVNNFQRRLIDLDFLLKNNASINEELNNLTKKLEQSNDNEKELQLLVDELSLKKKSMELQFQEELKLEKLNKENYLQIKNTKAIADLEKKKILIKEKLTPVQLTEEINVEKNLEMSNLIQNNFTVPIKSYAKAEFEKKGITFLFEGKNEVHSPKAGKIVYVGSLANFGNVLMIEHGEATRSVLLGQFDILVKNGDLVQKDQILAVANASNEINLGKGKIYFEIRKNNLAQNTNLLLDKKIEKK